MQSIRVETRIAAPADRCFLLSLGVELHLSNMAHTGERAVAGVTQGLIGLGETVTWQGRHFGCRVKHKALITQYQRPHHFRDVMLQGMFRSFEHDHYFEPLTATDTVMRDDLRFAAPLGPLGRLAEAAVLRRYLERLLIARNQLIRGVAEAPEEVWRPFLPDR